VGAYLFRKPCHSPPRAASPPLAFVISGCVVGAHAEIFFAKHEKTLDSWYSGHIIRGSFAFFVTRAGILRSPTMTAARDFRHEADAVAGRLPES
jgi:hypothetical protein